MYRWACDLFPVTRSITGCGVRATLAYLKKLLPDLTIREIRSGTKVFDWTIPDEWTIRKAYITDEAGNKVVDIKDNNLHVVGYSEPVDMWLDRDELDEFLFSIPQQPSAIPYVTSYYSRRWGFCLTHSMREALPSGRYRAVVDSDLEPGVLNYGELILPGQESGEILLSTYICHPSMANNELSGPVVTTALARWLHGLSNRRYTYRIVFVPETIGCIAYLSEHLKDMKQYTIAGFVVTCVGDDRSYSLMPSRRGDTLADRVAKYVLDTNVRCYRQYSFLDRGSDERQYCSPNVDLPVVSIMRTKYGSYPEYHTSLDDLSVISAEGLGGGFNVLQQCLKVLEANFFYHTTTTCEPQLGKRGLYPSTSTNQHPNKVANMQDLLAYADGETDLLEIASSIGINMLDCAEIAEELERHGLLEKLA